MATRTVRWHNWCGNQSCAARHLRPRDLHELRVAVREASARGRVRVVGRGASWSPLVPTDGTLLAIDRLRGVRELGRDARGPTIRMLAGTTLRELVPALADRGLALTTPTVFQDLTIGGAIATGSHGTGLAHATLSDEVVALTLVTVRGEVVRLTARDGELFHAAQLSLGTFGVIHDVTLRCAAIRRMFVEDRYVDREHVLTGLDDLLASHPCVELYWFPFAREMFVKAMTPIDGAADRSRLHERLGAGARRVLTHATVSAALPLVARLCPRVLPTTMRLAPMLSSFAPGERIAEAIDALHYQRAYPRCVSMSFGVPLVHASTAWRTVIGLVEAEAAARRFPVDMVVHARFIGQGEALLSMAHGRATCDIEVVSSRSAHALASFHDRLSVALGEIPGARAHWGKLIARPETIRAAYPHMDRFLAHRADLDPGRVLLNDFLERDVFGLDAAPRPDGRA